MILRYTTIALLLWASVASCQVEVKVSTSKPAYLMGEPIWVIVDVKNIGTDPVGHSECDGYAELTVDGAAKRQPPNLWGCSMGMGGSGFGCGVDHPPMLAPGKSVTFRYLLKDYELPAGNFTLHAVGKAGVRWKYYTDVGPARRPGPPPPPPPPPAHKEDDPVEGAKFDVNLAVIVNEGNEEELRRAYESYLTAADSMNQDDNARTAARRTIAEYAPPFLERTILGFAHGTNPDPYLAVEGLSHIHTRESRQDLVSLYYSSDDLTVRKLIARALAQMATPYEARFFAGVLPGLDAPMDDDVRTWAALGLGHIRGDDAALALISTPGNPGGQLRQAIAVALGNTKSPLAVPALIDMYGTTENKLHDTVCGALRQLTHYQWCDGSGIDAAKVQLGWRKWWQLNASSVKLYGDDECPVSGVELPRLQ